MNLMNVVTEPQLLSEVATERLEAEISSVAATIAAFTCRWLAMIAEYDRRKGWEQWECRSMTHWLVGHVGLGRSTARERVRVANALTNLPLLQAEFAAGRLSYSRVRAVTRVATAANEPALVNMALSCTEPQLQRWVTAIQRVKVANDPDIAELIFESRSITFAYDDNGAWIARFRLPPEIGAIVANLIATEVDAAQLDEPEPGRGDERLSIEQRRADAFTAIIERAAACKCCVDDAATLETPSDSGLDDDSETIAGAPDLGAHPCSTTSQSPAVPIPASPAQEKPSAARRRRCAADQAGGVHSGRFTPKVGSPARVTVARRDPLIVVHRFPDGAELNKRPLPITTADRLACDCITVSLDHDLEGNPLKLGRTRRSPNTAQRRAARERDQCCRFTGCEVRKGLHLHHVKYWTRDKGFTDLDNMIYLCTRHHRAVHEKHWRIVGRSDGQIDFVPPDRTGPLRPRPPADLDELVAGFLDPLGPIRQSAGAGETLDLEMAVWGYFANEHLITQRQSQQGETQPKSRPSASAEAPREPPQP